ncbi:uncharacterized protein ATC70_003702 [Mucor velutinosus]|uniref:FHA domain-containing protein n=1 Tax=Mucor velutinosus TaxID=708070 RepID=A0AAN7HYM9_9FUNG|nr:hypothetical protein ATC70_003702 [Mucor velutinosus]
MSKSITNTSFNDPELSKGYHLLTESAHTVKVNTPSVPPNTAHRYPLLAGSNWTYCISEPRIVIGRSATAAPGQKRTRKEQLVHVDFVDSNTVSRRHCEIRFSARRERWELYVYGRNGVKINHVDKKPRDKPTVLKTGSLIEINGTTFVFILPDNFIQPRYPSQRGDDDGGEESEITTPNDHHDTGVDHELASAIVVLFNEAQTDLSTNEIMTELKKTYNKPVEKETLLHLLVIDPNFHLSPNSISMSSKESDQAKWSLLPASTCDPSEAAAQKQLNITEPVIITESTTNNHELSNDATNTKESTDLPPALLPSVSLSRLFNDGIDDGDWSVFMPDSPLDQSSHENSQQPAAVTTTTEEEPGVLDQPSSLEAAPSLEAPSSLEWESGTTPGKDNGQQNEASHPSSPRNNCAVQEGQEEQQEQPSATLPANAPPALFRGLSIESMYSLWTSSTSSLFAFEDSLVDDALPNKRLKHSSSDGSTRSSNRNDKSTGAKKTDNSTATGIVQTNIYKEIHTRILI